MAVSGANFGDTIMEGEIKPEVQIQAPVEDRSGLYLAEGLNGVLSDLGTIAGTVMKNSQEDASVGILANYRKDMLLIADAADQTDMSPSTIRMRQRQLYGEYIANNPGLATEIDKVNSQLLSSTGMAHVTTTGNEQVQREKAIQDSAYAAGWISADGTPDVNGFVAAQREKDALESYSKKLTIKAAEGQLVTAGEKRELTIRLQSLAEAGIPWVQHKSVQALQLIEGGADPGEVLTALKSDVGNEIAKWSAASQGEDIAYITKPALDLVALVEDEVTKGTSNTILKGKIEEHMLKSKAILLQDPETAAALTVSEIFGQNAHPDTLFQLTNKSMDILKGGLVPPEERPSDFIGSDGDTVAAIEAAENGLKIALENPTPEVTAEAQTLITNMLRSAGLNAGESVKDYRKVIDFFASPTAEQWIGSGNLIIPQGVKDKAAKAIQDNYESVLLPVVEDKWLSDVITLRTADGSAGMMGGAGGSVQQLPMADVIEPVWNGTSVSFKPKAGYENNPTVVGTAKALNTGENSIAVPLNTLIRAKAHMNGSTDYSSEWELIGGRLFDMNADEGSGDTSNIPPSNDVASLDVSASSALGVTLTDFNEDLDAVYRTVSQTSAVDPQGMVEASTPVQAARAFLGFNENNRDQNTTLAAFIRKATGTNIDPAKTAWCAAFVDAVLRASNVGEGTGKLNARSYLDWGKPVDEPSIGDIVVLSRGDPNGWQGHVGFFMGFENGKVKILGGNQSDSVSEDVYDANRVLGYRRAA